MKGLQPKGIARRNKMLLAAIQLFLEQGYEKTTTAQIARAAGMSPTSFFAAFENKEALLLTLTQIMFENQFAKARTFAKDMEPLMVYCLETSLQIYITELSEPLREIYVMAYTLPSTTEYILKSTAVQIKAIFSPFMPDAEDKDFYEMDIASGSIMRGFMARKCDMYFTVQKKISRFLECCLKLYDVPKEKRASLIEAVLAFDLHSEAKRLIDEIIAKAETGLEKAIESTINEKTKKRKRIITEVGYVQKDENKEKAGGVNNAYYAVCVFKRDDGCDGGAGSVACSRNAYYGQGEL